MDSYSKDLIESFCLEIIANSNKIIKDAKKISVHDFSSNSSLKYINTLSNFAEAIQHATKAVYKQINWSNSKYIDNNFRILKRLKESVKFLSTNLKYIEDSKMSRVPWGLSSPLQKLAESVVPDANVILYQQWDYNYSIITSDINEYIANKLSELEIYIPQELYESILQELSKPLYLISFPYLEKNNILQYSLLGHEVGHLYADKILKSIDIKKRIFNDKNLVSILSTTVVSKPQALSIIEDRWQRIFKELLSDVVATVFFGPAMLFSMLEFSLQQDIDTVPSPETGFYPPWRARLRICHKMVLLLIPHFNSLSNGSTLLHSDKMKERIDEISNIISETNDIENMKKNKNIFDIFSNAEQYIESIFSQIIKDLGKDRLDEKTFFSHVDTLSQRLSNGIPPNIIDDLDINTNATLCEIINASWKYRISWESKIFDDDGEFNEEYLSERKKLNQLTNKAIEYSDLANKYKKFKEDI